MSNARDTTYFTTKPLQTDMTSLVEDTTSTKILMISLILNANADVYFNC